MPALLSEKRELFVQGLANGLSKRQAALNAGFSENSASVEGSRLAKHPAVLARLAELNAKVDANFAKAELTDSFSVAIEEVKRADGPVTASFVAQAVRERVYRLTVIQDLVDRLRMVIDERAAAARAEGEMVAPGAASGLLVRRQRVIGSGKAAMLIVEWVVDGIVVSKLYEGLKQAAIEAGEWQEEGRVLPPATVDVSDLTPEQVLAEMKVLRRAKEEIEAIRQGKEPTAAIEASIGSVEQVVSGPEVVVEIEPLGAG